MNQDLIGLWGGENLYQFAPNAQEWLDPFGLAKTPTRTLQNNWLNYVGSRHTNSDIHHGFPEEFAARFKKIADIDHIEHFTGFGLYDRKFIDVMKQLKDSNPYLRGIVAELGPERAEVFYEQKQREKGKSSFNFFKLYDVAMLGITSYSKVVMRLATILGFLMSGICFILAVITIIMKIINWNSFQLGIAGLLVGMFFMGSVLLFFIGFLGEYILNINTRVMERPLVIEQKRLGFDKEDKE